MTSVFKFKSRNCIEWTVQTSSRQEYVSEKFILQENKCNLLYKVASSYYDEVLYLESCVRMKTPVDVRVILNSTNGANLRKCQFTGMRQEIWSRNGTGYPSPRSLTFEVIIFSDIFKECQGGSISGSLGFEEFRPSSYLQKEVHFQAVSRDFSKLLNERSSCDVAIKCDDKTFNAHKIVLQARSTVFAAMLKSNMVEGKTGAVNIKEIKSSIFECFLKYLYSGVLPKLTKENAEEYYSVADQYDAKELKKACSEFMTKNITEGNACDLLVLADLHNDKDFRNEVLAYIVDKKIPQRDRNWSEFCNNHCSLANEILNLYIKKHCPQ